MKTIIITEKGSYIQINSIKTTYTERLKEVPGDFGESIECVRLHREEISREPDRVLFSKEDCKKRTEIELPSVYQGHTLSLFIEPLEKYGPPVSVEFTLEEDTELVLISKMEFNAN